MSDANKTPEDDHELSDDEQALLSADEDQAAPATDESPATSTEAEAGPAPRVVDNGRVLIVGVLDRDINDISTAVVRRGYEVDAIKDPRAVAEKLSETEYDAVFLAMASANLKALGVLRDISRIPGVPPLLFASRNPTPSLVFQAARAGADYVVVIPLNDVALNRLIDLSHRECAA